MKKAVPYIFFVVCGLDCQNSETAAPISVTDIDTVFVPDTASKNIIDSLKVFTTAAVQELQQYQQLKQDYEQRITTIVGDKVENNYLAEVVDLRRKLAQANAQIKQLTSDLARARVQRVTYPLPEAKPKRDTFEQPYPDDNAILVTVDGKSRKGDIDIPDDLLIYIIPYNKLTKHYADFSTNCTAATEGYQSAQRTGNIYFFNSVTDGKYIIKICTYFGGYKVVNKSAGKQEVTIQLSPPLQ